MQKYEIFPVPARRATVRDVLDLLDDALDKLTAPADVADVSDAGEESAATADPLAAHQGDVLDGGWHVVRRLRGGSIAVALLCRRTGSTEPEVLKVAKDEDHAERLLDEARALETLRHPGIVELLGVERIGGRTTLRLAPAGDPDDKSGMTLADRLDARGRLGLDLLERFGTDLLEVVDYLESEGIPHRDIKPDNLGVRPAGATGRCTWCCSTSPWPARPTPTWGRARPATSIPSWPSGPAGAGTRPPSAMRRP